MTRRGGILSERGGARPGDDLQPLEPSPLTGEYDVNVLWEKSVRSFIDAWRDSYHVDVSAAFAGVEKVQLCYCRASGLQYFSPLRCAGGPEFYEALQSMPLYYQHDKWEHRELLSEIRQGERVLEIGCGNGAFLSACSRQGIFTTGLDFNRQAVETARVSGLDAHPWTLQEALEKEGRCFDWVCSFHTLEHVSDPAGFVEEAIALLKPGGRLALVVPNADSYIRYERNLLDMPPHHVTRWSARSFAALQSLFPLVLEDMRFEPLPSTHVGYWVHAHLGRARRVSRIFQPLMSRAVHNFSAGIVSRYLKGWLLGQGMMGIFRFSPGPGERE